LIAASLSLGSVEALLGVVPRFVSVGSDGLGAGALGSVANVAAVGGAKMDLYLLTEAYLVFASLNKLSSTRSEALAISSGLNPGLSLFSS